MKPLLILLCAFCALMGCQQRYAPLNPVEPVPNGIYATPTPNPCPSIFSFEAGSPSGWSTTSWNNGVINLGLDTAQTYCGARALKVKGNWGSGGNRDGYVEYDFPGTQPVHFNLSGATNGVSFKVYTNPQLPSGSTLAVILAAAGSCGYYCWPGAYNGVVLSPPGNAWFEVKADYVAAGLSGVNDVQQILLNIHCNGAAPYTGDIWIDEVNW